MAVAAVLIFAERIWLGRFKRAGQTEDDRIFVEQQTHVALEMNRAGRISARRKSHRTLRLATRTAVRIAFLDGPVDGGRVVGDAIAFRAKIFHIVSFVRKLWRGKFGGVNGFKASAA